MDVRMSMSEEGRAEYDRASIDAALMALPAEQAIFWGGRFVTPLMKRYLSPVLLKLMAQYGEKLAAKGVQTTLHGAERVAGAATRGEVLSAEGINATKNLGKAFTQGDGATVFLHEVTPGRFNAVVEGIKE